MPNGLFTYPGQDAKTLPASSHPLSPLESVSNNRIRWNALCDCIFKINFDIAIRKEVGTGLRLIVRDSNGYVLAVTMKLLQSVLEPREVEVSAFRLAISQDDLLLFNACYDTDCLQLFQQWKKRDKRDKSLFHGIIVDCKMMLANSTRKDLPFTERDGNQTAHSLTSLSFSYHEFCCIEEIP